jgi:hypothetical protein
MHVTQTPTYRRTQNCTFLNFYVPLPRWAPMSHTYCYRAACTTLFLYIQAPHRLRPLPLQQYLARLSLYTLLNADLPPGPLRGVVVQHPGGPARATAGDLAQAAGQSDVVALGDQHLPDGLVRLRRRPFRQLLPRVVAPCSVNRLFTKSASAAAAIQSCFLT